MTGIYFNVISCSLQFVMYFTMHRAEIRIVKHSSQISIYHGWMDWLVMEFLFEKVYIIGLILYLRPANESLRYFITTSLIGWVQA